MEKKLRLFLLLSACLMVGLLLINCNGGGGSTSPTTLIDVTGDWNVNAPGQGNIVLHLNQDAQGNITGTVDRSAQDGSGSDQGNITAGSNTNNNISITIVFPDTMTLILNGTVSSATSMSGTFSSYYDPNNPDEGNWAAAPAQ